MESSRRPSHTDRRPASRKRASAGNAFDGGLDSAADIKRQTGCASAVDGAEIGFEARIGRIEQLTTRDDDDVDATIARRGGVVSKDFSNQSFSPVSAHGIAQLSGCHDPKPCAAHFVWHHEQREKPTVPALASIEHPLELRPAPEATVRVGAAGRHCITGGLKRTAPEYSGAAITTRKPSGACALWRGVV
jgi:hypothetical protein